VNVSAGGLLVVSPVHLPVGLAARVRLPEQFAWDEPVLAVVARAHPVGPERWYAGMRLVHPDAALVGRLREYVSEEA
jgi:hypothetical protein